jgi:hypothetical protein
MIVRYNYNQQIEPPAPFIYVTVIAPDPRAGETQAARHCAGYNVRPKPILKANLFSGASSVAGGGLI